MTQRILFATNRNTVPGGFGENTAAAGARGISCGTASVDGIDIKDEDSGIIAATGAIAQGGFSDADIAPILASANDVLVFIHVRRTISRPRSRAPPTIRNGCPKRRRVTTAI